MKSIFYLFVLSTLFSCSAQEKEQSTPILGKWIGDKTIILYEGDTLKINDNDLQEIFFKDSVYWGFEKAKGYEVLPYSITSNYLIMNGEKFELLELNDSTLIYKAKRSIPDKFVIDIFRKAEGTDW